MRGRRARRGQAIVESLLVVLLAVAAFLFFQDFAMGLVARLLLDNAAANAARADAVGFNDFHRAKSMRVGMIPISGRRLVPGDDGRGVAGAAGELALVRTYLQAQDWAEADGILDYERWEGLRHDVRLEAGEAALTRATAGWVDPAPAPETRSDPFHRVNAYARLDAYAPQPISRLPASNYTLAARDLPEGELGLQTETREERVPLEAAFIDLIYNKNSVLLRETAAFPAASGLWD